MHRADLVLRDIELKRVERLKREVSIAEYPLADIVQAVVRVLKIRERMRGFI